MNKEYAAQQIEFSAREFRLKASRNYLTRRFLMTTCVELAATDDYGDAVLFVDEEMSSLEKVVPVLAAMNPGVAAGNIRHQQPAQGHLAVPPPRHHLKSLTLAAVGGAECQTRLLFSGQA
ncbi:hypothetical protein HJFPF1_04635 [Paramyrothecium foliicola]|nr:hypothetical protein HJFPF1_04635 [Paramyrothecium foliicola]